MDDNVKNNYEGKGARNALVAILGRPSAGKSTFLNAACQEPVSIVSPIPQTTRNAIRGIVNTSFGQLVFVDTPGYHASEKIEPAPPLAYGGYAKRRRLHSLHH